MTIVAQRGEGDEADFLWQEEPGPLGQARLVRPSRNWVSPTTQFLMSFLKFNPGLWEEVTDEEQAKRAEQLVIENPFDVPSQP